MQHEQHSQEVPQTPGFAGNVKAVQHESWQDDFYGRWQGGPRFFICMTLRGRVILKANKKTQTMPRC